MSLSPPRRTRVSAALAALLCLNALFAGAGLLAAIPQPAAAQGGLTANQQATLEQVRQLLRGPDSVQVRQLPDGTYFADTGGALTAVLLAARGADGQLLTRCVETLEEAAAFLAETPGLAAATVEPEAAPADAPAADQLAAALAASQTSFEFSFTDPAGVGFNDPTPASPVGGNAGTTVGEQRRNAFAYAAAVWGASLQSTVPIRIQASFAPLFCTRDSAVLGQAGPKDFFADFPGSGGFFPGAERPDTWYASAIANQRAGADLNPAAADLTASFNGNLGQEGCLPGTGWYYGFDGNEAGRIDLVATLLHEFGHGLGFLSAVSLGSGSNFFGSDDIWNYYLTGAVGGGVANTLWKDMTSAQRATSATSGNLVWGGPAVTRAAAALFDSAAPTLTVTSANPVGPFSGKEASFGPALTDTALAGELVAALDLDEDGAGAAYSTRDACTPLTNAGAVAGKVALVDRGPCAPSAQARNLQAAGAIAAVIADTVSTGTPPDLTGDDSGVTIPTISLTKAAGESLRGRIAQGATSVSLALARTARPALDSLGRVKMYAPASLQSGSSVSHFDTAASGPDLLMEPRITTGLTSNLDLTDDLMRDIGWMPDLNYNGLDDRRELGLSVAQYAIGPTPFPSSIVRPGEPFTVTVTARNQGYTTAGASLAVALPATYEGATWRATYSGGAAGPPSGSGSVVAALTLPPGSRAVFTIVATAPAALGALGSSQATIAKVGGPSLVDASGSGDDSATLSLTASDAEIWLVFAPLVRR